MANRNENELELLPELQRDSKAVELLRLWVSEDNQHYILRAGALEDPSNWGIILANLMRHIAYTYEQEEGMDQEEVLQMIYDTFNDDLTEEADDDMDE
jgi:hypothetical protein